MQMLNVSKTPQDCADMTEIRAEIDRRDHEVVRLLGERFQYVQAAAKYKSSATSVRAPERFAAMLQERREWARLAGLSEDAIEKLFRDLVEHFIEEEMRHWEKGE